MENPNGSNAEHEAAAEARVAETTLKADEDKLVAWLKHHRTQIIWTAVVLLTLLAAFELARR